MTTAILRSVTWQGCALRAWASPGLLGALAVSRALYPLLFELKATEPTTYIVTALAFRLTAALVCAIPAWRGSSVDPQPGLRQD